MNDSMLNRIKNRSNRPSVQRDTSLTGQPKASTSTSAQDIQAQIDALPQVAARRNIRLLKDIDADLNQLCQQHGITIETFLEACYVLCDRESEAMQTVIEEASTRLKERKQAGKLRRIYSQLQGM